MWWIASFKTRVTNYCIRIYARGLCPVLVTNSESGVMVFPISVSVIVVALVVAAVTAAIIAVASRVEEELPVYSALRALYSRGRWLFSLDYLVVSAACHSSRSFGGSGARVLDGGVNLFLTLVMSTVD